MLIVRQLRNLQVQEIIAGDWFQVACPPSLKLCESNIRYSIADEEHASVAGLFCGKNPASCPSQRGGDATNGVRLEARSDRAPSNQDVTSAATLKSAK